MSDSIEVGLILASMHFESLIAREEPPDIHLVMRMRDDGSQALEFDGASYALDPDYNITDADHFIQKFVRAECLKMGRTDLLEGFHRC